MMPGDLLLHALEGDDAARKLADGRTRARPPPKRGNVNHLSKLVASGLGGVAVHDGRWKKIVVGERATLQRALVLRAGPSTDAASARARAR